jgi:hypothetical protein
LRASIRLEGPATSTAGWHQRCGPRVRPSGGLQAAEDGHGLFWRATHDSYKTKRSRVLKLQPPVVHIVVRKVRRPGCSSPVSDLARSHPGQSFRVPNTDSPRTSRWGPLPERGARTRTLLSRSWAAAFLWPRILQPPAPMWCPGSSRWQVACACWLRRQIYNSLIVWGRQGRLTRGRGCFAVGQHWYSLPIRQEEDAHGDARKEATR